MAVFELFSKIAYIIFVERDNNGGKIMKKKIFLAIFLIVSMAVPAFSYQWEEVYDYSEKNIKKYEDLLTNEFNLIRDEIFAPKYPKIKDVEIIWDYSEED